MSSIRQFVFQDDKLTNCQRCNSCVSCYYFIIVVTFIVLWLGGIVSVVCSIVLSKGFKPFMWDLTRAATWPEIVRSGSLTDASHKLFIFMCLSGYWQWNLTNEPERISVLIVKKFFSICDWLQSSYNVWSCCPVKITQQSAERQNTSCRF